MRIKPTKKEYVKDDLVIVWQPHKCIHSEKCWRGMPAVFQYGKKPWVNPDGADAESIANHVDTCPSGALSYYFKSQQNNEQETGQEVKAVVLKDGPVLLKGNIKITHSNGEEVVEKNPALCRCGGSNNKPFCDGNHSSIGFEG